MFLGKLFLVLVLIYFLFGLYKIDIYCVSGLLVSVLDYEFSLNIILFIYYERFGNFFLG